MWDILNKSVPKTLYDEKGEPIEVMDDAEIQALKDAAAEREELKTQLGALEEGSPGIKSLREAIKRKDEKIAELTQASKAPAPVVEQPKDAPKVPTLEEIQAMTAKAATNSLLEQEIARALSKHGEDDRKTIRKFYEKLTNGEEISMENVHSFISQAEALVKPNTPASRPVNGHVPRPVEERTNDNFADTDAGKGLAARLGLNIQPPKKN